MCSAYWNLVNVTFKCPACGEDTTDVLQTHFMGDVGSCMNDYEIGQPVEELRGVDVVLDGRIDDFIGGCEKCDASIDFGADIKAGAVVRVWPYQWTRDYKTYVDVFEQRGL